MKDEEISAVDVIALMQWQGYLCQFLCMYLFYQTFFTLYMRAVWHQLPTKGWSTHVWAQGETRPQM